MIKYFLGTNKTKDCEEIIMNSGRMDDSNNKYSFEKGILKIHLQNLNENQRDIQVVYNKRFVLKAHKNVNKYEINHYESGEESWEKEIKKIIQKGKKEGTFIFKPKRNLTEKILNCFS